MKGRKWLWGAVAVLAWTAGSASAQTAPTGTPAPGATPAGAVMPLATPAPKPVAVVNGEAIGATDLDVVLKLSGPVAVHLPEAQRRQRQMEALSLLIDNLLLRQFLAKNTPAVPPAEVDKRLAEFQAGLKEQGKSLAEHCHDTHQTMDQLRAGISDHIRWATYIRPKVADDVVAKYYQENKDYFDGVTVQASHIVLRVPAGASEADKAAARAKLTDLRAKIVAGTLDFAEVAKKYSQDPVAAQGGDLGYFPRKLVFDESFSKAAFALQVGQVSDIVQTEYGLHLIKVTGRKPGKASDFAKIKEGVREFCAEDMRMQLLNQQRKAATIEINLP
jgi:parvulin-like peptidyl-prolyl isomerase